ncbi:MAG: TetR/AcrR family transcriptional regulator [Clostridiales bacterium]|nr:TetR/AcrR family transcriptional regulator [Clostridiales bacterium]
MPRVSEEYKEQKRREIINAAHNICLRKPVGMVTMTDIINETGMAQGGIYRYFEDIDDIFRAMILDMRESYSITERTDEIFKKADDLSVEDIADMICDMLADRMEEQLMDIQKINFDLSVLAINEPERTKKILGGIKSEGNLEHLTNLTGQILCKADKEGKIRPAVPVDDIVKFIAASYSGIQMNCIIGACYQTGPMGGFKPRPLFNTLAQTIKLLLGAGAS